MYKRQLLFVPGLLITLGAGWLFGVVIGTVVVSIGSVLGLSLIHISEPTRPY